MSRADQTLARIRNADPAPTVAFRATARDETLAHILAQPRMQTVREQRAGRALRWFAVAAAASIGLGALTVVLSRPVPVYASWTPVPTPVAPAHATVVTEECPGLAHRITGSTVEEIPLPLVLVDVRGDYSYALSANHDGWAECFLWPGTDGRAHAVGNDLARPYPMDVSVDEDAITVEAMGTSSWRAEADLPGALTSALGRAGTDVVAVAVVTASGQRVEATVANGWWAAWSPGLEGWSDRVLVTLTDGRESSVTVPPVATSGTPAASS